MKMPWLFSFFLKVPVSSVVVKKYLQLSGLISNYPILADSGTVKPSSNGSSLYRNIN
jgi:hypothetical protein